MGRYTIVEASDVDAEKEAILGLWERNHSYDVPERIAWLYRENPLGSAVTFLARNDDNQKMVGCASVYPWNFRISGKDVRVAIAVDFGVDEEHRVFGPALSLQRALLSSLAGKGFDLAFVYPDRASGAVFQRVGYESVGSSKVWAKVLRWEDKIAGFVKVGVVAALLGSVADVVSSFLHTRFRIRKSDGLVTDTLGRCDERFDALWHRERLKFRVIPHQDSEYLNWRYSDCTTAHYRYFCLFDSDKQDLQGFVVYDVKAGVATVKDVFPAQGPFLMPLLAEFAARMRKENVGSIGLSFFGNDTFTRAIGKLGFIERETKRDYLFFLGGNADGEVRNCLLDRSNYYFFFG